MIQPVYIRMITFGTGTPIHSLSKLCSKAIEHLVKPEHLPRHSRSTKDVVKRIFLINDQHSPLPAESEIVFSDIKSMYPNTDIVEGVAEIKAKLEADPSPLGMSAEYLAEGLKICLDCNCVQFRGRYYFP